MPTPLDDTPTNAVLVVTAHPDDVDFGAAGTVAQWVREGFQVTYCIITDGDAGGFDPAVPRSEIPRIRREEQTAAGAAIGVHDVRFLGYRDGELAVSHELRRDICRVIRQVQPTRMLIQSPDRNWTRLQSSHPDHLAAGEAAIQAIYPDAENPFAHTSLLNDEGLEAWKVNEIWVMASPNPNTYVDITDDFFCFRNVGSSLWAALVDKCNVGVHVGKMLRKTFCNFYAASVWRHDGDTVSRIGAHIVLKHGHCSEVVDRAFEEALNLSAVQVDRDHALRTCCLEEVGN